MRDDIAMTLLRAIESLTSEIAELRGNKSAPLEVISARTFAKLMDCSVSAVEKGARSGAFPAPSHKIFEGLKGWRWKLELVEKFLEDKQIQGNSGGKKEPMKPYVSVRKRVKERRS